MPRTPDIKAASKDRRATVHDVARLSRLSLATIDRVLNARPGVRPQTIAKVDAAIKALDFRRDLSASLLARARHLQIAFLIPDGGNAFMASLALAIEGRQLNERLNLKIMRYATLDPGALVACLAGLAAGCAVIVAPDDPRVAAAVNAAARRGIDVITLVSDLPDSARRHFIGIDNVAAGRTAAALLGRFCRSGTVGLIAGSLGLRDHRQRFEGFAEVMAQEFPAIAIAGPFEGLDQDRATAAAARNLLTSHSDLAGIYNLGAGNAGLLAALNEGRRAGAIRVVAHELSDVTRAGLRAGWLDVVLDQNPDREIEAAIGAARQLAFSPRSEIAIAPIETSIFVRDNLS